MPADAPAPLYGATGRQGGPQAPAGHGGFGPSRGKAWATSVLNWRSGIAEHVVGDELEAESVCETLGPSLPHCFASKGMAMLQRQGLSRKDKQLMK